MPPSNEPAKQFISEDDMEAVESLRNLIETEFSAAGENFPWPGGMQEHTHSIQSLDGTALEVRRFVPASTDLGGKGEPTRAIVLVVGGGMIGGSVDIFRRFTALLSEQTSTQVFVPAWRIAPENPYPAGVEDVYATILWLQANAGQCGVVADRVVLAGFSAGGGVAAGVALMARDKKLEPPLAAQCLRYPMLDDRTELDPASLRNELLTWTVPYNDLGWKLYLSGKERGDRTDDNVPPYAAPSRTKDHSGLPPTLITTCENDLFRDENLQYAVDLSKAGVKVELHIYPGVPHGFEADYSNEYGRELRETEARFIQRF